MNEPIVDTLHAARAGPGVQHAMRRSSRANSVAGRALVVVIAIMTFLACLTAGAALLVVDASRGWRSDVLRDATIQVKPRARRRCRQPCRQSRLDRLAGAGRRVRSRLFESGIGEASRAMARQRARPQPTADPSPYHHPIPRPALRGSRRRCDRLSRSRFLKPISTIIGCGRRASGRWPTRSSSSPPLFSR